jgi:hypothetical protein
MHSIGAYASCPLVALSFFAFYFYRYIVMHKAIAMEYMWYCYNPSAMKDSDPNDSDVSQNVPTTALMTESP